MFTKLNIKIIQLKDIISLLIILFLFSFLLSNVFASANNFNTYNPFKTTTRNLAMFASIAYADLEKIPNYNNELIMDTNYNYSIINCETLKINRIDKINENDLTFQEANMVTDSQLSTINSNTTLLGIPLSDEKEDTYSYLFYNLASTEEVSDWKIVNYTKFRTTVLKGTAEFTAMTFKNGNDIVIAYRGTDFDDIGDWTQDIMYGLIGYAGQESIAQDYANVVAKHYSSKNNNINIYITGHSLGGYLAQIGGSSLVSNELYSDNVAEISYFNGMGLNFYSNIVSNLKPTSSTLSKYNINTYKYKLLTDKNSSINTTQSTAKKSLTNWKYNGGKIVSYNINGDMISSLGTHVGEQIGFDAHNICIEHHNGNKFQTNCISKSLLKTLRLFFNKDISFYINQYKPESLLDYVWITHETDSFFGVLPYEDGSLPPSIKVEINTPSTIKYNKTATATLTITTTDGTLKAEKLKINNFAISNKTKLKLISVSSPVKTETTTGYKYVYKLKLKGGIVIGNSTITLKPNILKLQLDNTLLSTKFAKTSNSILESNIIKTKLR